MSQARLSAYLGLEPKLPTRRREVFKAGASIGTRFTIKDLQGVLGFECHRISGRVTELVRAGWFVDTGRRSGGMTIYEIGAGKPPAWTDESKDRRWAVLRGSISGVTTRITEGKVILTIDVEADDMPAWVDLGKRVTIREARPR
jgi:hypothetical protein